VPTTPSTAEITKSRAEWAKWLEDTADVIRTVRTRDAYGGETETDETVVSDLPISMTSPVYPGTEQVVGGRQTQVTDSVIAFPVGSDVRISDRLVITSQANRTFEVLYLSAPASYQLGEQAFCREAR
jgi:hypothetical protein